MVSTRSGRQATAENRSRAATNRSIAKKRATIRNPTTASSDSSQDEAPMNTMKREERDTEEEETPVVKVPAKKKSRITTKRAVKSSPEIPKSPQHPLEEHQTLEMEKTSSSVEPQTLSVHVQETQTSPVKQDSPPPLICQEELEEFKELVRCTVCLEILRAPIYSVDVCAHKFCSVCITPWIAKSNDCPQCRKHVGVIARDTFAESIVELLIKVDPMADQSLPWSPR